jgi:hypothetical protein
MSASMYIVVEGEDPGYDIFVNGHALARNEDALEKLALRLGVKPLLEFFSADQNSMALLLEESGRRRCLHRSGSHPATACLRSARFWISSRGLRRRWVRRPLP